MAEQAASVCINSCLCGLGMTLGQRLASDAYDGVKGLCCGGKPHAASPRAAPGSSTPDRYHYPQHGERAARRKSERELAGAH